MALVASVLVSGPAGAQTTIRLSSLPARTPPADTVFVAGSFNGWNPRSAAHALRRQADGSRTLVLPVALGEVEFKLTRGSWNMAETDAKGQALPNRRADLRARPEIAVAVQGWSDQASTPAPAKKHSASPQVHTLADAFRLPQLGRRRRVLVYLPADYARQPTRRYPVLYLHDGQNVFDEATSYSGEWGVDETLDRLRKAGLDPAGSIVVAVDNGQELRTDEYIPWPSAAAAQVSGPHRGGQGVAYTDFLARTLKPYVDAHYRTRPDAAHTGIAGSSLGGLISFYAALRHPKVFGQVGVFSPAFWVCQDSLWAYAQRHPAAQTARFYFVCGPQESDTMLPLMAAWRDRLKAQGVPAANISFHAPADGEHREWFWRREFPKAYQWLFLPGAGKKM